MFVRIIFAILNFPTRVITPYYFTCLMTTTQELSVDYIGNSDRVTD